MSGNHALQGSGVLVGTSLLMERCARCDEPILPGERHVVVEATHPTPAHRFHHACAEARGARDAESGPE